MLVGREVNEGKARQRSDLQIEPFLLASAPQTVVGTTQQAKSGLRWDFARVRSGNSADAGIHIKLGLRKLLEARDPM